MWDVFQLFPGYQKHLGRDYKVVVSSWELESVRVRVELEAFPSGSCALPSVMRSDGAEGVSLSQGSSFLPVSSINLNAKTQTCGMRRETTSPQLQMAQECPQVAPATAQRRSQLRVSAAGLAVPSDGANPW